MEASMRAPGRADKIRTSLGTQAAALLRKNVTFQRRNWATNLCLVSIPVIMCVLLAVLQVLINSVFNDPKFKCGCTTFQNGTKACGLQYSTTEQMPFCPVPSPPQWPAFMQVPPPQYRAVNTPPTYYPGVPPAVCKKSPRGCPTTILYSGKNKKTADTMANYLITEVPSYLAEVLSSPTGIQNILNSTDNSDPLALQRALSNYVLGTSAFPSYGYLAESAVFASSNGTQGIPFYLLQSSCAQLRPNIRVPYKLPNIGLTLNISIQCVQTNQAWRKNSSAINDELYNGYAAAKGDPINEYTAAFDFQNTTLGMYDALMYFNATKRNDSGSQGLPPQVIRVLKNINMATNAFVKTFYGEDVEVPLLFVKDFPKDQSELKLDFSLLLGPLFYMWILQLLYPVFTTSLVYEKEKNLRMMMRMHGLGDGAYWLVSYAYCLALSLVYVAFFMGFGSAIGLKFFRLNNVSIVIVFFLVFINMQISFSMLTSTLFSSVKTATVACYLYVFGSGLLGEFLFRFFMSDANFPREGILGMEFIPAFALYRGLYELSQSAFIGNYQGTQGTMTWSNLASTGCATAMVILAVEWLIFLLLALYLDQVVSSGSGVRKSPFFFLQGLFPNSKNKKRGAKGPATHAPDTPKNEASVEVERQRPDVEHERETVERVLRGGLEENKDNAQYSILCDNMQKVYPGRDGNPPKKAVRGMSLAVPRGECFGMLGPNGAGKSTSISMMIGFNEPTGGTAIIEGLDIRHEMDSIYSIMGVCPQHDLLWEQLSGSEHLLFYGRLKNLKGKELQEAVEESLKSVNLFAGGVGNRPCGTYSGGMKRRLSVAISLIGNPLVVYMDEPSTGLDPASRMNLWEVVKEAKKDRAIILTTHSMEEAEQLCDRLGIFVDGQFQCIGNPKELTARYGGTYVLTMTTPPEQEAAVAALATSLTPNAHCIYSLAGTQKFELPIAEVDVADIFARIEESKAKAGLKIQAWGIANTTLEDVFIRIATEAQAGKMTLT